MMRRSRWWVAMAVTVAACRTETPAPVGADRDGFSAPTAATRSILAEASVPVDPLDADEAARGFVAREDALVVKLDGSVVYDRAGYDFIVGPAPGTVHPSLWRQAGLNNQYGLFKVAEGIWQVRGYDLANMTLIQGRSGWIVVDPLTTRETAARALALARRELGAVPVSAVLYTHSHVDHFGGARGVVTADEAARIPVYAPAGFMEEATSENVLAGPGMMRRSMFMYGRNLPRSPRGKIDNGLGKEPPASGNVTVLPPTVLIDDRVRDAVIDGVAFEFQYTPGSEAPAEMTFYLPVQKVFCGAEVVSRTLHNLYTLRGAKVRDAQRWSMYIDQASERFSDAQVMMFSHHWPVWGRERIDALLQEQHDTFRFIHDQTLRLANRGYEPRQIAERLTLPAGLQKHAWNRGYYGTLKHDIKAVYQMYFGWYDGNPAHLDPLPRIESDGRYVEAMGGVAAVVQRARTAHEAGDDRWAAELLDHVVSADGGQAEARGLLAEVYDQLGYRAESSAWRNVYLSASQELRQGPPATGFNPAMSAGLLEQLSPVQFMQALSVALDGVRAADSHLHLNVHFTDLDITLGVQVRNGVLVWHENHPDPEASATLAISRAQLVRVITRQATITDLQGQQGVRVEGNPLDLIRFMALLDAPDMAFPIVTARP